MRSYLPLGRDLTVPQQTLELTAMTQKNMRLARLVITSSTPALFINGFLNLRFMVGESPFVLRLINNRIGLEYVIENTPFAEKGTMVRLYIDNKGHQNIPVAAMLLEV